MKRLILGLASIINAQLLDSKNIPLPTFTPISKMSKDIAAFIAQSDTQQNEFSLKAAKRDILGRTTQDSTLYLTENSSKKIKVVVDFTPLNHSLKTNVQGRYELSSNNSEKNFWLNGEQLPEVNYFESIKELAIKQQNEIGTYRAPQIKYLTAKEIKSLMNGPDIVFISKFQEPEMLSNDTTVGNTIYYSDSLIRLQSQIQTSAFSNGYKGQGIGVYFTETGCPKLSHTNTALYNQGNTCIRGTRSHPTQVVRVLQTTAPNAMIYGFDQENYPEDPSEYSPQIYIGSHSWSNSADSVYTAEDQSMDNYIYSNKIIEFVAAGNIRGSTNYVTSPGKAVNAITVGAINPDSYTYASYSGWKNPSLGNQKPEVVNFTHFYFPNDPHFSLSVNGSVQSYNGTFNGTSASTPYTAAMAADVLSQHSFFKNHPEMFKALMMTGSTKYINNSYFQGDKDNYHRIRKLPLYSKMAWNTRSAYWNGNNDGFFGADSCIRFTESSIDSGKTYRIAISWLTLGSYVMQHNMLSQDLDLFIYQGGTLIASSSAPNNPFELVGFTTNSSTDLTIVIKRIRNAQVDNVILGYNLLKTN